jgi:hypothetical protein
MRTEVKCSLVWNRTRYSAQLPGGTRFSPRRGQHPVRPARHRKRSAVHASGPFSEVREFARTSYPLPTKRSVLAEEARRSAIPNHVTPRPGVSPGYEASAPKNATGVFRLRPRKRAPARPGRGAPEPTRPSGLSLTHSVLSPNPPHCCLDPPLPQDLVTTGRGPSQPVGAAQSPETGIAMSRARKPPDTYAARERGLRSPSARLGSACTSPRRVEETESGGRRAKLPQPEGFRGAGDRTEPQSGGWLRAAGHAAGTSGRVARKSRTRRAA